MQRLSKFPVAIVANNPTDYSKTFHSKIFTLAASSESLVYTYARSHQPHFDFCYTFFKHDQGYWVGDFKGVLRIRKWILNSARQGVGPVLRLYTDWQRDWERFTDASQKLLKVKLRALSDRALFSAFAEFYELYLRAGAVAYCTDSFMSTGEKDWLEELVREELVRLKISQDQAALVRLLTSPAHLTFTIEEEYELLRLAVKIAKRFPSALPALPMLKARAPGLYKAFKRHEERFFWIRNNYYNVEYVDVVELYKRIGKIFADAKQKQITIAILFKRKQAEWQEFKNKRAQLLASLKLSQYVRNVLEIARLFAKWKDVRKSGVHIGMHHFDQFLAEIGKRLGMPKRDLAFLCFNEIRKAFLGHKNFTKEIAARKQQAFFAVTKRGYYVVASKKAAPYFRYAVKEQSPEAVKLKGFAASPGKVVGRVRVIRKTEEMRTFKTGEILVTNQTTPEFVMIMRKAAAIVTEQGGITSHAAVISRELKKPCVIGTRIATRVLKNGDYVEVDAQRGVVRKI